MSRISVFARRHRMRQLEIWAVRAILAETFFLAIFPSVAAVAVILGSAAWFLRLQADSRFKMRSLPFDLPVMIFIMLGAVSVFKSPVRDSELIYNFLWVVGIFSMTYLLVGQNLRTAEQIKLFVKALSASTLIVVLGGFFQYVFGIEVSEMTWIDGEAFPEMRKRVFSTMASPDVLAGYLDVAICIALGLFAKVSDGRVKFLAVISIAMATACLFMTYSSGAIVALAIIFVIYGFLQDWRILILLAAASIFLLSNDAKNFLSVFAETADSTAALRSGIWVSTISMIADHPFIGIGWGAFEAVFPQYNYYAPETTAVIKHAHNLYLNVAAEIGIAGALAFVWYFFGTMFTALALDKNARYTKIRNAATDTARRATDSKFNRKLVEVILTSSFLQNLAQIKSMLLVRTYDISNSILDRIFPAEPEKKSGGDKKNPDVVHHDEMKWRKKPAKKKSGDDDKMDIQRFAELEDEDDVPETKAERDAQIISGVKLGVGLAFLSMALNGMSNDLLTDLPSAILMWQLGALGAAINLLGKE